MSGSIAIEGEVVEVMTGGFEDHAAFGSIPRDQCVIRVTTPTKLAGRIVRVVVDDDAAGDVLARRGRVAFELDPSDLDLEVLFSGALENLREAREETR